MSSYRPNYSHIPPSHYNLPPPPHDLPPLPPGPPPPYDSYRGDHWRPQESRQNWQPQPVFTFRNDDRAPHYPSEQDHYGNSESRSYAPHERSRQRPKEQHRDNRNLNRPRGQNSFGRRNNHSNYVAPSDRPLLRQRNETGSEELLGMTEEQAQIRRYMPAEDISDSDEESMDESDSNVDNAEQDDGPLEPPKKRRTLGPGKRTGNDGASEPKWSNPDPYTVLPPVEEEARKRKDVVKLIRKSDLHTAAKASQHNQVAANDDFISFGFEDDNASIRDELPPRPSSVERDEYGIGVPGAPSGPRQSFSHLKNFHGQASGDAPGTYSKAKTADSLGPPPTLVAPSPNLSEEIVVDTQSSRGTMASKHLNGGSATAVPLYDDGALGNRKRTYDDEIKYENFQTRRKAGFGKANGSILPEWLPGPDTDPLPWLRRSDTITANAGFRSVAP